MAAAGDPSSHSRTNVHARVLHRMLNTGTLATTLAARDAHPLDYTDTDRTPGCFELCVANELRMAWHGMAWHGWESGRRTDGFSSHFHSARQPKRQPWQAPYWRRCCATQRSPDASKLLGPVTSGASCFCQTDPPAAGTPAPGYSTTRLSQWFVLQPNHFGCSCLCSFGGSRQAFWFDWQVR